MSPGVSLSQCRGAGGAPADRLPPPPRSKSRATAADPRATTVVRIPLRSAKHHFGVTRSRGNRPYNEDWYQAGVLDVPTFAPKSAVPAASHRPPPPPGDPSVFYFAVFDGHGGEDCSRFLKDHLHAYIEETGKEFGLCAPPDAASAFDGRRVETQDRLVAQWKDTVGGYFRRFQPDFGDRLAVEGVLMYAFLKTDMDFITKTWPWFLRGENTTGEMAADPNAKANPFKGGSTASIALISTA